MHENDIAAKVVHACYIIHVQLGPGLFESVYEEILTFELQKMGLNLKRQVPAPVMWKGMVIKKSFYIDILIEDKVILELKSVESLSPVHYKQLKTYLKITGLKLGLLINFNERLIKDGITRIPNGIYYLAGRVSLPLKPRAA